MQLTEFYPLTDDDMPTIIRSAPTKSCSLDPVPTWLLKQCSAAPSVITIIVSWFNSTAAVTLGIGECATVIKDWMQKNYLKLNGEKTEMLIVSTPSLSQYRLSLVALFDENISASDWILNLGVMFDNTLSMKKQVSSVCKRAFYQIKIAFNDLV
ncbi:hypothetical protein CAPTEDRAFT_197727 [Capitella teleta]|uniref:Reverse transcriptase domain-containing protein n=1 Tax=Capitella teleta TaxID=283909 RepID=R7U7F5_CAPTE|nr:hypothetical protein CAPTEDRAFT_197727 [Capitella teleta]|eukprot:ELT99070.1 hypothetical protein CAPTEDRAFT_197727 [Capitella teleta]